MEHAPGLEALAGLYDGAKFADALKASGVTNDAIIQRLWLIFNTALKPKDSLDAIKVLLSRADIMAEFNNLVITRRARISGGDGLPISGELVEETKAISGSGQPSLTQAMLLKALQQAGKETSNVNRKVNALPEAVSGPDTSTGAAAGAQAAIIEAEHTPANPARATQATIQARVKALTSGPASGGTTASGSGENDGAGGGAGAGAS